MVSIDLTGPRGVRLRCRVARTRRERLRGLIGRDRLGSDEGILLPVATSVHTFGMRMPILVSRLDAELRVLDVRIVSPRRILAPMRRARHVVECSERVDLRVGDVLRVEERPSKVGNARRPVTHPARTPPGSPCGGGYTSSAAPGAARAPIV